MPKHRQYLPLNHQVALAGMLMLVFDLTGLELRTKRSAISIRRWRDGKTRCSVDDMYWMVRVLRQRIAQMLTYSEDTYDHWLAKTLRREINRIRKGSMGTVNRHRDVKTALVVYLEEHLGKMPVADIIRFMELQGVPRRTVYNVAAKMQDRIIKRDGVWHLEEGKK